MAEIVAERKPKRIGINTSRKWSFGDGLTGGLRDGLMEALGPDLSARTASAEALCVRWLETRTPREFDLYAHMVAIARGVVSEAFSERVITPGVTTTADVEWYIRQRFTDLGLSTWFSPDVNRQSADRHAPPNRRSAATAASSSLATCCTATSASRTCASTPTRRRWATCSVAGRPMCPKAWRVRWRRATAGRTCSPPNS